MEPFDSVLPVTDACCDAGLPHGNDPFGPQGREDCGTFWYECGFGGRHEYYSAWTVRAQAPERWTRLRPYQFVQYTAGTRIVSLAASEAGRKCIPRNVALEGPCPVVPPLDRKRQRRGG